MGPQAWNPARHLRPLKSCNRGLAAAAVATESGCVAWRDFRRAHGKTRRLPCECLHILRLPALPWRVIIDSETRSLYNKADNWVLFFFFHLRQMETILWNYFSPIQLSRPTERGNDDSKKSKERRKADSKSTKFVKKQVPISWKSRAPWGAHQRIKATVRPLLGLFFPSALCTPGSRQTCFWPAPKLEPCIFFYFKSPPQSVKGDPLSLLSDSFPETQLELSSVSAFTPGICI